MFHVYFYRPPPCLKYLFHTRLPILKYSFPLCKPRKNHAADEFGPFSLDR